MTNQNTVCWDGKQQSVHDSVGGYGEGIGRVTKEMRTQTRDGKFTEEN